MKINNMYKRAEKCMAMVNNFIESMVFKPIGVLAVFRHFDYIFAI